MHPANINPKEGYQHPYSYQLMETSEQREAQRQRGTVHYGERSGHQEEPSRMCMCPATGLHKL